MTQCKDIWSFLPQSVSLIFLARAGFSVLEYVRCQFPRRGDVTLEDAPSSESTSRGSLPSTPAYFELAHTLMYEVEWWWLLHLGAKIAKDSMLKSMANGLWYVSSPAGEVCVENVDIDAKPRVLVIYRWVFTDNTLNVNAMGGITLSNAEDHGISFWPCGWWI